MGQVGVGVLQESDGHQPAQDTAQHRWNAAGHTTVGTYSRAAHVDMQHGKAKQVLLDILRNEAVSAATGHGCLHPVDTISICTKRSCSAQHML
jgi:hypothetical protein